MLAKKSKSRLEKRRQSFAAKSLAYTLNSGAEFNLYAKSEPLIAFEYAGKRKVKKRELWAALEMARDVYDNLYVEYFDKKLAELNIDLKNHCSTRDDKLALDVDETFTFDLASAASMFRPAVEVASVVRLYADAPPDHSGYLFTGEMDLTALSMRRTCLNLKSVWMVPGTHRFV